MSADITATVRCCSWRDLLGDVEGCDLLCVDSPYSARTHAGHDDGTARANRLADFASRPEKDRSATKKGQARARWDRDFARKKADAGADHRRGIDYPPWDAAEVQAFVDAWSPRTSGWFVTITDHHLAPMWSAALERAGRYVFSPLAFVAPGSRVRLTGDGPAQWSCWIVVARPKSRAFASWGALPGAYVLPAGHGGAMPVVGGKPIWLMQRLVEDYSSPGDLVVDPCCGAGTTLTAAIRSGRRAIGCDVDPAHAAIAADWIANPWRPGPRAEREPINGAQLALGGVAK